MMSYDQVILITGARDWTDAVAIKNVLEPYKNKRVLLIHGDCRGVDKLAGNAAKDLGFSLSVKPANWTKYGRAAGPIRNKEMVNEALAYQKAGISTIVLAFHDDLSTSKGTKQCVGQAEKAGLEIILYSH